MALKYNYHSLPPSSSSLPILHNLSPNTSLSLLFRNGRPKPQKPFYLSATPSSLSSSSSTTPIFLPHLQPQEPDDPEPEPEDLGSIKDPILRFFKSRSSIEDPDPGRQGKLSLQKNRRSSWHLAVGESESDDAEAGLGIEKDQLGFVDSSPESEFDAENGVQFGKQQLGSTHLSPVIEGLVGEVEECAENGVKFGKDHLGSSNLSPGVKGLVREILEIARNLPENATMGELLGDYEGKIGERESVCKCWG